MKVYVDTVDGMERYDDCSANVQDGVLFITRESDFSINVIFNRKEWRKVSVFK